MMRKLYKNAIAIVISLTLVAGAIFGLYYYLPILFMGPHEPLSFYISNKDSISHNIAVEIMDSNNRTIFNRTYSLGPGEKVRSPEITYKKGEYLFKVTLDHNITETYLARVDLAYLGIMIWIYLSHEEPIHISQAVT